MRAGLGAEKIAETRGEQAAASSGRRNEVLIAALFARTIRAASLQQLVDDLTAAGGCVREEWRHDLEKKLQTIGSVSAPGDLAEFLRG